MLPADVVIAEFVGQVGLIHGHQIIPWGDKLALGGCACRLGVDMLISGHTHRLLLQADSFGPYDASICLSEVGHDVRTSFQDLLTAFNLITLTALQTCKAFSGRVWWQVSHQSRLSDGREQLR
eukprot:431364-Amphidinium_carterae.2